MTSVSGPTIHPHGYWAAADAHVGHGWSPALASWIRGFLRGQEAVPVHDFGCGLGHYARTLSDAGFRNVTGYEGEPPARAVFDRIVAHDLTEALDVPVKGNVVCLEVAEHVPVFHEDTLLATITNAVEPGRSLILSWAVRGQGGDGHVNCRNGDEVLALVSRRCMVLDEGATRAARAVITDGCCPWFRHTVMVFARTT